MSANTVALAYLIASVFFILTERSEFSANRSPGQSVRHGGNGNCRRHYPYDHQKLGAYTCLHRPWRRHRSHRCSPRGDDSNAGAGGLHALPGWPRSGFHRYRCGKQPRFIRIARHAADGQQTGAVSWHLHWSDDVVRLGHSLSETVRPHERRTDHFQRPAYGQPDPCSPDGRFRPVVLF